METPCFGKKGACPILESFYYNNNILGCELIFPRSLVVRTNRFQALYQTGNTEEGKLAFVLFRCALGTEMVG